MSSVKPKHNPETTKQALHLLGISKKDSFKYNKLLGWLFEEPGLLVSFLEQEVNRLSKLPQLPTFADASKHGLHSCLTDVEHGLELLLCHISCHPGKWPKQLCESGAAQFLVDFMNRDREFVFALYRNGCYSWGKMFPALFDCIILFCNQMPNMPPRYKFPHSTAPKAWQAMWNMVDIMDKARREYLADPALNRAFSLDFECLLDDKSLERPGYFSGPILQRVLLSGRFLAQDYDTINRWSSLVDSHSAVTRKDIGELFQFIGMNHIVAQLRQCLPARTPEDYFRMCLHPVFQFNTKGNKEFHELFWKTLAQPMIEQLRDELNKDHNAASFSFAWVQTTFGIIMATLLKPSPSCMAICQVLASSDFFALIARTLVICASNGDKEIQTTIYHFTSCLVKWVADCESEYSLELFNVLLASIEPIFLITLDRLSLLQDTDDLDKTKSKGTKPGEAVLWLALGEHLGLRYYTMRTPKNPDEPLGCSWRRCPFFHQQYRTGKPMFACSGCFKVQYCTQEPCQTRDWHEGGHKHNCTNRAQEVLRQG